MICFASRFQFAHSGGQYDRGSHYEKSNGRGKRWYGLAMPVWLPSLDQVSTVAARLCRSSRPPGSRCKSWPLSSGGFHKCGGGLLRAVPSWLRLSPLWAAGRLAPLCLPGHRGRADDHCGTTRGVRMGQTATKAECDAMFTADLVRHEAGLRACLKSPDALPDKTYIAFLSWTYNVGVGAACSSTALRLVNAGDVRGGCHQLPRWNKDNGRVIRGLTSRRAAERDLCLEGLK